jgi:DNA-directed RNA polymerase specialized sigma24 family protein
VVEHLFRHEAGKMVATLTRIFGLEHLTLAEDVVQEALALRTCPFYGVPENPSAWIMRTSRNLALDVVRREKVFREKEAEIVHLMMCGETGVRTRNGNLSTVRSSLLVDWSANALRRNAQPPSQSSWSSSTRFAVKRAVIEFWSVFF